jgi:drug/metabolite transporter (DMT)-like permease
VSANRSIGLIGSLGICLTAGLALPFVNILRDLSPGQLLVVRGYVTAAVILLLARTKVFRADRMTLLMGACVPFASLGLFMGIREWGAAPTIVVITLTPVVNFAAAWLRGKKIGKATVISLAVLLTGVALACGKPDTFSLKGLLWSLLASFMSGVTYELLARAKSGAYEKCFWGSVGIGSIGLFAGIETSWLTIARDIDLVAMLLCFALVGGFLYWIANVVAFANLPTESASVLAQAETPAVILMAHAILGERLSPIQWVGVIIALAGAGYLSYWLSKKDPSAA